MFYLGVYKTVNRWYIIYISSNEAYNKENEHYDYIN